MNPVNWLVLGLLLVVSEFIVPEFVIFFFGLGAIAVAAAAWILPGTAGSLGVQLLLWAVFSGLSLVFLRTRFSRLFRGTFLIRRPSSEYAGEVVTVTETITPTTPGRISFQGTTWDAISLDETYHVGDTVEILEQDGSRFVVTRSLLTENSTEGK
jgi:inner membrane protein